MAWPRVLVTGFGPFPGVPENPSAWLVEALRDERPSPGAELHVRTLPTEWSAIAALAPRLHADLQPHVMIHFGLCQRAADFRIERAAFNRTQARADACAALPPARIVLPACPERLDTRLPVAALAAHLKARGVAASVSPSAGRYLCNYLYYLSLAWAARQADPPLVLFVHIPQRSTHGGAFTDAMFLHGALEIVRFATAFANDGRLSFDRSPALGIASPLEGEAGQSLIGREGGAPATQSAFLIPLPDPLPQGGRECSSLAATLKDEPW